MPAHHPPLELPLAPECSLAEKTWNRQSDHIYYTSSTSTTSEFAHVVAILQTKTSNTATSRRECETHCLRQPASRKSAHKRTPLWTWKRVPGGCEIPPWASRDPEFRSLSPQRSLPQPKSSSQHGLGSRFDQKGRLKSSKDTRTCPKKHNAHK